MRNRFFYNTIERRTVIVCINSKTLMQIRILETNIEAAFISLFRLNSLCLTENEIIINSNMEVINKF